MYSGTLSVVSIHITTVSHITIQTITVLFSVGQIHTLSLTYVATYSLSITEDQQINMYYTLLRQPITQ